jgi:hypothetical protein
MLLARIDDRRHPDFVGPHLVAMGCHIFYVFFKIKMKLFTGSQTELIVCSKSTDIERKNPP